MIKKIITLLLVLCSLNIVSASVLDQRDFIDSGDFSIERGNTLCKTYEFDKLNYTDNSEIIFNLIIENYISTKADLDINVSLNGDLIKTIIGQDLLEENIIYINEPMIEKNKLNVCVKNNALPKITISKKSTIGTYLLGNIREGVDFYQKVLTNETYSSSLIPIEVYVYNSGQDSLNINLNYASETFLKNSNLETVSGQTNYYGKIDAGQTITIKYYLKTNKNLEFSTPRAELKYIDDFGTENTLYAKQEIINVTENQNKIEVYVDLEKNALVNESKTGKIILKNISQTDIKNVTIETNFDGKIIVSQRQIPVLRKFEVTEIPFEITTDEIREYTFTATVYYNLGEKENGVNSQTIIINAANKKDYVKETIGVFLIIAIAIYIWLVRL
ncbi:MAG TPA: hypothetical protein PK685_00300 [archaeon]|nr:hypothetical protein [archaeon]